MVDELVLIKSIYSDTPAGRRRDERRRTVLVEVGSPSRAEWGTAGQAGFQSDFVMRTPVENYDREEMAAYHDELFSIYRTYLNDATGEVELYLSRKRGADVWAIPAPTREAVL